MSNGYGSYRCTREADFRAFDQLPPQMREVLRYTVADWGAPPILKNLRQNFAALGSRREAIRVQLQEIRVAEDQDCWRYYGPDHPEARSHGKRLRRARSAAW